MHTCHDLLHKLESTPVMKLVNFLWELNRSWFICMHFWMKAVEYGSNETLPWHEDTWILIVSSARDVVSRGVASATSSRITANLPCKGYFAGRVHGRKQQRRTSIVSVVGSQTSGGDLYPCCNLLFSLTCGPVSFFAVWVVWEKDKEDHQRNRCLRPRLSVTDCYTWWALEVVSRTSLFSGHVLVDQLKKIW